MSPQVRAVVALIVNPMNEVLVIRSRKPGRQWELPGDGIQEGESPMRAIHREVLEETGIGVDGLRSLGILAGIPREGVAEPRAVELFIGRGEGTPKPGSDAQLAQWCTARLILDCTEMLSPVASRVALLAWAEGARGAS